MPNSRYYKLDGHIPIPVESIEEAIQNNRLGQTIAYEERNDIVVSTVFSRDRS